MPIINKQQTGIGSKFYNSMQASSEEFVLSTETDVRKVDRFIEEILDFHNIPGEYFGNVFLAVTEAMELLKRRGRPMQEIRISVEKSTNGISFTMRKRRDGTRDRMDEIDLHLHRQQIQREVFIIQSLADEVHVRNHGDTIQLLFVISGIPLERSLQRSAMLQNYLIRKEKVTDANEC